jgi:thiamine biosynthesis lipoprotein ApbE
VLDKYQQYSPEQSIIEILDNWLRNHAGQPTWKEIAEALRKIGLQKLAFDIERVYDTGKLSS